MKFSVVCVEAVDAMVIFYNGNNAGDAKAVPLGVGDGNLIFKERLFLIAVYNIDHQTVIFFI